MPVSRPTTQMANQPSPSPMSKGKKPMAYPQQTQTQQQQQSQQQQQPRSERAASKAPLAYQSPPAQQNRHPSPPSSNTSKSRNTASANNNQKGKANPNKIWSTSTTEERERIKDFWLGLGEEERRNLVKIEKDTVLKKMKEQQKHSCSCAVCGRKRFVFVSCVSIPLFSRFHRLFHILLLGLYFYDMSSDPLVLSILPASTVILSLDHHLIFN